MDQCQLLGIHLQLHDNAQPIKHVPAYYTDSKGFQYLVDGVYPSNDGVSSTSSWDDASIEANDGAFSPPTVPSTPHPPMIVSPYALEMQITPSITFF